MKRYYLGLLLLAFSINTQALVILQYHHVRDTGPASTRISPERFAEHLAYIEKSNFAVLALPEVANLIR